MEGVLLDADRTTGKALAITRIRLMDDGSQLLDTSLPLPLPAAGDPEG
jgi:hypothetical protein